MCENCGASYITIHGRTKTQMYSGVADWDIIKEVKENISIPVIGNGDITSVQKAKDMLAYTKADGVMVARGALGNPWLIGNIDRAIKGEKILQETPTINELKSTLKRHIEKLMEYYGENLGISISRKYICWYSKNLRDAKKFREQYMKINNYKDSMQAVEEFFCKENLGEMI